MGVIAILATLFMLYMLSVTFFSGMEGGETYERYFSHNELLLSALFAYLYWFSSRAVVHRIANARKLKPIFYRIFAHLIVPIGTAVSAIFVWTKVKGKTERLVDWDIAMLVAFLFTVVLLAVFGSLMFQKTVAFLNNAQNGLGDRFRHEAVTGYTQLGLLLVLIVPCILVVLD